MNNGHTTGWCVALGLCGLFTANLPHAAPSPEAEVRTLSARANELQDLLQERWRSGSLDRKAYFDSEESRELRQIQQRMWELATADR